MTAEVTVEKALSVTMRGYFSAVQRVEDAVAAGSVDEVYISVTEALQWLTSLAERRNDLRGDQDVEALIYARERAHHQSASIIYLDSQGSWFWRPVVQLPLPTDHRHQGF